MKGSAPETMSTVTSKGQTLAQTSGKPLWSRPAFDTLALEQTLNTSTVTADSTADQKS